MPLNNKALSFFVLLLVPAATTAFSSRQPAKRDDNDDAFSVPKVGEELAITFDRSEVFDQTIEEFFKTQFEKVSDVPLDEVKKRGLESRLLDNPDIKVPKLDANLMKWAYYMFQFTYPTAITPKQKEGSPPYCWQYDCGYLKDLKDVIVFRKLLGPIPKGLEAWTGYNQQGTVYVDKGRKMILAMFKGAPKNRQKAQLLLKGNKADMVPEWDIEDGDVHRIANKAVIEIYELARRALNDAHKEYPDFTIVFGGHSMGATIAPLVGSQLAVDKMFRVDDKIKDNMKVFSSGGPRYGNKKALEGIMKRFPELVRFTRGIDPFPNIPGIDKHYAHTPVEVWTQHSPEPEKKPQGLTAFFHKPESDLTPKGVITIPARLCTGYENKACNAASSPKKFWKNLYIPAVFDEHMDYLGNTYVRDPARDTGRPGEEGKEKTPKKGGNGSGGILGSS